MSGLGACVPTVRFSALPPGRASVLEAQAAERSLRHPATVSLAAADPAYRDQVSMCLSDGRRVTMQVTRIEQDQVCGVAGAAPATEQCWRFADLRSVGKPYDATAIGYYAVRGYLDCREDT